MDDTLPDPVRLGTRELPARGAGATSIASVLRREILEGYYHYGDRLPAERRLADHFGASRGTIREALRQLEDTRLVTRRVGSGTFVKYREHPAHEDIAEATSPMELIEVRSAVEPHIVRLAVLNASPRDLERLGRALEAVEAADTDPESFSRADERFHLTLAECSKNPLMLWVYRHINDVRGHAQWSARKDNILTPSRIGSYNTQHRALYEAVISRDMEGAVRMINTHLGNARADLLGG